MSRELSRRGVSQRFADFAGGHEWLPESIATEALDFMTGGLTAAPPPPESREQKKAGQLYVRFTEEVERGDDLTRRSILRRMQRDSKLAEDGLDRRVARRVLAGTFIGAMEQGRRLLDEKKYVDAARAWDLAALARPDNAQAWYALAMSRAGANDKRGALDALQQAIANGFRDRDRLEGEPLFERLRKEPKFISAIAELAR